MESTLYLTTRNLPNSASFCWNLPVQILMPFQLQILMQHCRSAHLQLYT
jgi:hypothetical protein